MARVLLTTLGSYGDLYPYIAVGIELRHLGHAVLIATSASYREKVESAGLEFAPVRPDISLDDAALMRAFFDPLRGTERVARAICSVVRETYQDTLAAARGCDAIVTHPITFAAVLVAQKLELPWISSVLAPGSFISAYDPPVPAPAPWLVNVRAMGPGAMAAVWRATKRFTLGWFRPVLELRQEIGLAPGGHPLFEGANSPDLVLALFSRALAEPQPDWPKQAVLTGFPFHDSAASELAPELAAFFEAGPPPLVFTLGSSAVAAAGDFYSVSLEVVRRLNTRALFLGAPPGRTPPEVLVWPYAPHEQVFPRASVIVHQGGIGTTAQALRSGRPMLVVPFAHDQFDNAARVRRLGAATTVPRQRYSERTAVAALQPLLTEPSYREAAKTLSEAIRSENGAATAARAIDLYLAKKGRT
jgi:rhamnosyltransferase subunit B